MTLHAVPGLVAVSSRALERTAVAVAAGALGVDVSTVRVRLADEAGSLGVSVTAPLRVAALRGDVPRGEVPSDGILTRLQAARHDIRNELTAITGRSIGTVSVAVTRAEVREEKRVR